MKVPSTTYVRDKHDFLASLAANRRVLHVGCADALADVASKERAGRFLHARLAATARELWGCDLNERGLSRLRDEFGFDRLVVADAQNLNLEDFDGERFDLIIAAEVIEHLPNPGGLLASCHRLLTQGGFLCITTPNGALRIKTFAHSLAGKEDVSPDHVVLLSFTTLTSLYRQSGFGQPRWFACLERHSSSRNRAANVILDSLVRRFPWYADCLISIASPLPKIRSEGG
jgi:SAM-dependent methyltransferase